MSVLKFQNPGKRKLSLLSREEIEKLDKKVPGTNTNSNRTVTEAKKRAKTTVKVKEDTRAANRRISKQLADEATARMAARRERQQKGIQERPVSQRQSDAYASSYGEIKDGNQAFLDKAMSWYGLSNGLGQATNISDRWRATPSFANFVGRSTPEAMAMAGSLVANPVGTILGMGTGHLGSQAGGYIGEQLGNREAGEIAGSLVGMPFGYKVGTTLQRTVPNYYRNYTLARAINQGVKETELPITRRTISVNRSENSVQQQPDLVYTLYNEFGEPIGQTNVGGAVFGSGDKSHRMVDGVMSMRNAHKVSEDTYNAAVQDILEGGRKGLESGWSLMSPQKTLAVTKKFPHEVIGQEFGNPVRLLTGTTDRPIPTRVKGNHYQEIKPQYKTVYNETTGDIDWIPIEEKTISTERLYNHPGAFLGNTVKENGGITVNGEGVLRRPYSTPQTVNEGTVASGLVNDQPIVAGGKNFTVNEERVTPDITEPLTTQQRDVIRSNSENGRQRITTEDANKELERRLGRGYDDLTEDEQDMLGGYANIRAYSENGQKAGGEAYSSEWDYVNNNLNRMANQEGTLTTRILKKNRQDTGEKPYELEDLVENGRLRENTALEETLSGSRGEDNFFSRGDDATTRATKYLNVKYGQKDRGSLGNVGEDNPHYRSGVIVTTGGNQYSFDSFGHALKDLYKNLKQGRRFSWLNKEQEYTRANNFGQLNRYTEDFSPEFREALIQSNGQLPEGVTVTDVGNYLFFRKDGRILGKLKHRELQDIIDNPLPGSTQLSPNQWIKRLNTEFNLNIPLARVNEGRIEWPNIYGLIYRKGGQLKKRNLTINGQ